MELSLELIICIIIGIILVVGTICLVINQKKSIKEWLYFAVTEAEKFLGGKTGRLKLRFVYENFIKLFPFFSKFVTFGKFSKWVDLALDEMKKTLMSSKELQEYIGVEHFENVEEKGDDDGLGISK